MSNAAKFEVPGSGDDGKAYTYNEVGDAFALTDMASHTHSGVYEPAGTASTEVAAHAALADPHPGYLLEADGPELIRDTMGTALVPGSNVTITVSDGADTITIASSVTSAVYDPLDTITASGSATSADISTYGVVDITLTGNCTISITGPTAGQGWSVTFILRQDGTGSRTVSWPAGTVWPGGSEPTLSTAAGAIDIVVLMTVDGGTEWFGSLAGKGFA